VLVKIYGEPTGALGCYSPDEYIGSHKRRVKGRPDPKCISTSFAERQNLTMRMRMQMQMRRLRVLTNAQQEG
jgi:hypothetical protein